VDIVVLAERTLFVISEAGHVKSQKKLDYLPTAVGLYNLNVHPISKATWFRFQPLRL
jgi:hypothetical protein